MKIGLALSGGGVLGAAHIKVLEELEKNNIKIDEIAGVSAGSIIGAVYASGGLAKLNDFFLEVSKLNFTKKTHAFKILTPARFYELALKIIDKYCYERIEDMPIKFNIVATNILTGKPKVFSSGDTIPCLKASCAYPGIFPVQKIDKSFFIDGGVTCNLPSDAIREKVDFLIGSNLNPNKKVSRKEVDKMNRAKVLLRTLDIIKRELNLFHVKECDFCFEIDFSSVNWYSFHKVEPIIAEGSAQTKEQMPKLLEKLKK